MSILKRLNVNGLIRPRNTTTIMFFYTQKLIMPFSIQFFFENATRVYNGLTEKLWLNETFPLFTTGIGRLFFILHENVFSPDSEKIDENCNETIVLDPNSDLTKVSAQPLNEKVLRNLKISSSQHYTHTDLLF